MNVPTEGFRAKIEGQDCLAQPQPHDAFSFWNAGERSNDKAWQGIMNLVM